MSSYDKARKLTLEEVIPYINQNYKSAATLQFWCPDIEEEIKVHLYSSRIRLIGRTQNCAACKIKGDHFWVESNCKCPDTGKPIAWHLNLYALNYHGDPVMMTLDHIKPRSKKGTKMPENIQLLCTKCNEAKNDNAWTLLEIAEKRATNDPILEQVLKNAGVI